MFSEMHRYRNTLEDGDSRFFRSCVTIYYHLLRTKYTVP
jgi:hypothetical protein